jgi:nitrite reductase/ring-hydroxylating ferredoxin subunit
MSTLGPRTLKDNEFHVADVPPGSAALVGEAAVFNVDGNFCATQAKCTHMGGPLSQGALEGSTVTCPWHGSQFNVCSGEVLRGPATDPLTIFQVTVEDDIGRVQTGSPDASRAMSDASKPDLPIPSTSEPDASKPDLSIPSTSEPRFVVAHREDVWWLLSEAAQLEHMLMCQYLFAAFSLKQGPEEGLTAEQAQVVARWRQTLRGIAVQEMLHLALVSNLMTAIGAAPTFGRPNFTQSSGYFLSPIQLDLLPFGEQALLHFLYLERPEGMEGQDASSFVPTAPPRDPLEADEMMPRGQEYATIGHLYRGIGDGIRALVERLGEQAVFVGSPRAQATPELFHWPGLIAVTDLNSASAAVELIIEQGEGCTGDWRQAHYGRYLAMWQEYQELRAHDPSFQPSRPVLAAFSRQPFDIQTPARIITDPRTRQVASLTALAYELVLQTLNRSSHTPTRPSNSSAPSFASHWV